jgi:hypothetical protein
MSTAQENIARRARLRAEHSQALDAITAAASEPQGQQRRELEGLLVDVPRRPAEESRAG